MRPLPTNRPRRRASTGFTLIEIMIVIGLIALVMATGLPAFTRQARKASIVQAATDVSDACREARRQAILQGVPMEVVFRNDGHITVRPLPDGSKKPAGGTLEAVAPDAATAGEIKGFNLPPDVTFRMLEVNMADQMQAPTARVRFFANGTSDELFVVLQSASGLRYKVTLEVVTALPSVEEFR